MSEILAKRTHEKMKDVLMSPEADGPEIHYYMVRGGADKGNITIWDSGIVGSEYIKTYGHYHIDELPETYWILSGEGIALLQKKSGDGKDPSRLEEFKAVEVKVGDKLDIPAGWGHLVVNIGNTYLVTKDDSPVNLSGDSASMPVHADYSEVQKMRGFAYYVVEHNGAPALIKNENYKEIEKMDSGGIPIID